MTVVATRTPTTSASRYLQQLAKHWSHKMPVSFDADAGTIDFPNGTRLAMRAAPEALHCILTVPDGEDAEQMLGVVTRHLDRFAFREAPLTFEREGGEGEEPGPPDGSDPLS